MSTEEQLRKRIADLTSLLERAAAKLPKSQLRTTIESVVKGRYTSTVRGEPRDL